MPLPYSICFSLLTRNVTERVRAVKMIPAPNTHWPRALPA